MAAADAYRARREARAAELTHLRARASLLSIGRVVTFLGVVAAIVVARYHDRSATLAYATAGLLTLAFLVLVVVHDRVIGARDRAERAIAWADEGLARLEHRWQRDVGPKDPKVDDAHPYEGDLDVFGRASLLQSIDTTKTREGQTILAAWLREGAAPDEITRRQACARSLASMTDLRCALAVEGMALAEDPPAIEGLLQWSEAAPTWRPGLALRVVALVLPIVTVGDLFFGARFPMIPRPTWVFTFAAQVVLTYLFRAQLAAAIGACSSHSDALSRFRRMLAVVEGAPAFEEPELAAMRAKIDGASAEIGALARIVGFVDARRNEVFRFIIGPGLAWDLNWGIELERWRRGGGRRLREQLSTLARFEALAAFGARAFEQPDDAFPDVRAFSDADAAPLFRAEGLAHPLLDPRAVVRNDVVLPDAGSVLLVTGSNMSGKSTLLRAIGANVVLALAGAPVRARSLRIVPFSVHTSMRVRDSLSEGVSHFLAELRRLKEVVDAANAPATAERPVLFLLDEILHGTNSRERHLGARAIVGHLVGKHACGAVSTHDLALAAMAEEHPGKVVNVHFREGIEADASGNETMTFDYVLRGGVVTSSNALRLMRVVGIDVPIPAELAEEAPS